MLEKFFKSENALLKITNELLKKNIENYKETIVEKDIEIKYLRDKLEKESLSEGELVGLLISQYKWLIDYELFKGEYVSDCFTVTIEKSQKIHKEDVLKLIFNTKEK